MSAEKTEDMQRRPSLMMAIGVIALVAVTVSAASLYYKVDVHTPIVMLAVVIGLIARYALNVSYKKLENAAIESISMAMQSCMILMLVGMLVGVWMRGGVIPGLIYYGLALINPKVFPLVTLIICSIVSISTGSSWSTNATVGIAMMGIGNGLGMPPALTAGIVVSGAYFGDKMSPLSDTTNLAPAVSGGELFDHIRAMLWTTGPTYIIVMVVTGIWGFWYSGDALDATRIEAIRTIVAAEFPITALCLIPPLLIVIASALKFPAMPGICIGIVAGMVLCFMHGSNIGEIWTITQSGYSPLLSADLKNAVSPEAVQALLSEKNIVMAPDLAQEVGKMIARLVGRGGLLPMMWSVSLAIIAMAMGGFLEAAQILNVMLTALTSGIKRVGGLVAAACAACLVSNLLTGSQYLSIIIPGKMFKAKFDESGLAPRMLSRSLEDSGTLTSALIPWNLCGAYAAGVLGVPTLEYAPYAVLNWLNVIVAIAITYMGIGIFRRDKDGRDYLSKDTSLGVK